MTRSNVALLAALAAVLGACVAPAAQAMTIEINEFVSPVPAAPAPDVWYASDIRAAGTASIPDLTGLGGDLENNQPLPTGAALLTTGLDNADKAEVATFADFGDANTVLTTGRFSYDYYKATVAGGNPAAAPSLKLALFNPLGVGDSYGQLVYEPTWNQPGGGSQNSPTDAWQAVSIDSTTGGADGDGTGGWWWTGGFGAPNTAGGPPIKSLEEWAGIFSLSPDFNGARLISIAVGVGTFNQGQMGYFDEVSISVPGGIDRTYDFQAIPEPASAALLAFAGLFGLRRRR